MTLSKKNLLLCIVLIAFIACKKDEVPSSPALKGQTKRTILAYIFQDTNLWFDLTVNINDMERGWRPGTDGTMLVYVDASTKLTQFGGKPVLLEIMHDTTNLLVSKVVKVYEDKDAASVEVFKQVQEDVIRFYPADSYGLILSGHGDGFAVNPPGSRGMVGSDRWGANSLDVDVIANNLATHYDFLILDACLMAETTTLYQLRKGVDFVVASVELSPGDGFAYRSDLDALFTQPKADLFSFVNGTNRYYSSPAKKEELDEYGYQTIGVYRLAAMDKLAEVTKKAIAKINLKYLNLTIELMNIVANPEMKILTSMYYPRDQDYGTPFYYDMGLLVQKLDDMGEDALENELVEAIDNVVLQRVFALSAGFNQDNKNFARLSANLSFYIPGSKGKHNDDAFYNRFEWSAAAGFTSEFE